MSPSTKYMDIREFQEFGYLQEVNRRFFHPLGLALEIEIDDDGNYRLSGVWDYRDDPEGVLFTDDQINPYKYANVRMEQYARHDARVREAGFWEQPVTAEHLIRGEEE